MNVHRSRIDDIWVRTELLGRHKRHMAYCLDCPWTGSTASTVIEARLEGQEHERSTNTPDSPERKD